MRVLVICGAGIVSGKEVMCLHLLKELKQRGYDCTVVMSTWGSTDFKNRLINSDIPYVKLRLGFISKTMNWSAIRMTMIQIFHFPALMIKFFLLKKRKNPDVVIHTTFHHVFLLHPVSSSHRNLFWLHDIIGETPFYKRLFHLLDKKIETFVPVSEATATSLVRLGIRSSKIKVVKNGIVKPSLNKSKLKERPPFIFAVIGQVSSAKGLEVLLRSLHRLPKDLFALRIIGAGSDEYVSYLQKLAIELNVNTNCEWTGFINEIDKIYEQVDVVIVPSLFPDPYPTTVMEAGLRAIPVIGSTSGGLPEMIADGVNGFLFESGNSEALQEAILKIIHHVDFDLLKRRTLAFSERHFSIERFVDNFEKLLHTK